MNNNPDKGNSLANKMDMMATTFVNNSASTAISPDIEFRKTVQYLMPVEKSEKVKGYDVFPSFKIGKGRIATGFDSLAVWLQNYDKVIIDGDVGVYWSSFISQLYETLTTNQVKVNLVDIKDALKSEARINEIVAPYLGGDDPIFGRVFDGDLVNFFDEAKLDNIHPAKEGLTVLYGTGAALTNWDCPVIFLEVPKNEVQYRSRAGVVCNIGESKLTSPKQQYKGSIL